FRPKHKILRREVIAVTLWRSGDPRRGPRCKAGCCRDPLPSGLRHCGRKNSLACDDLLAGDADRDQRHLTHAICVIQQHRVVQLSIGTFLPTDEPWGLAMRARVPSQFVIVPILVGAAATRKFTARMAER